MSEPVPASEKVQPILRRFSGTILMMLIFSFVFLLEYLTATILGYHSIKTMLSVLTLSQKRWLVIIAGPFIHQGIFHIFQNMIFFAIFGGYVEWHVGRNRFLLYSILTGYLSSWVMILLITGAGAVGASSVNSGLEFITGLVGFVYFIDGFRSVQSRTGIFQPALSAIPLVFGIGFGWKTIQTLSSNSGGTQVIHAIGACVGLVIGSIIVLDQFVFDRQLMTLP